MSNLLEQARSLKQPAWTAALRALWPLAAGLAIGLLMHFFVKSPEFSGYTIKLSLQTGIAIILAVSLTVVNGFTGQFSMGHAGFMAVGGYVAAAITYYGSMKLLNTGEFAGGILSWTGDAAFEGTWFRAGDILFAFSCVVGGIAAAGAGYLVGLPSLRLKGDYLAIVTLGFGEIVRVLLQASPDQFQKWRVNEALAAPTWKLAISLGGPKGFTLLPNYTTLFWVYLLVVLTLIACYRLKTSSSGRAFLAIREDEIAAQAMGVDITKYKVRAFVLSAFFAGVAGGLYAMDVMAINAGDLGFQKSFDIIIMVVLGGMGSISGATLAAIILTLLPEVLRSPTDIWPWGVVWPYGLAVLLMVLASQLASRRVRLRPLITIAAVTAAIDVGLHLAVRYDIDLSNYRLIIYALLLITMMLVRPQGLFGIREVWELVPGFSTRRKAGSA